MMPPTWIACLTPPGTAAIAVLAVRGPAAWDMSRRLFRPLAQSTPVLPEQPEGNRTWLGWLGGANDAGDQVLLVVKKVSPQPWVEIQCHGGAEVVHWLMELFIAEGATACSWQQLEERTAGDRLQALALAELAHAPTARTAGILLDQHHGALAGAFENIVAAIDSGDSTRASALLDELLQYAGVGLHLTTPWRVAVIGPPNVGKSSLVNALAGYQRSLVSAVPGTTRDVVSTRLAVDGWPVELLDTAGLRTQAASLEEQGIALARDAAETADFCLWVLDASTRPVWPHSPNPALRLLVNKTDLPAAWDLGSATGAVRVSARTGAGLAELVQALAGWLVPQPPLAGAAVPFTAALVQSVQQAREACAAGQLLEARDILTSARRI